MEPNFIVPGIDLSAVLIASGLILAVYILVTFLWSKIVGFDVFVSIISMFVAMILICVVIFPLQAVAFQTHRETVIAQFTESFGLEPTPGTASSIMEAVANRSKDTTFAGSFEKPKDKLETLTLTFVPSEGNFIVYAGEESELTRLQKSNE